MPWQQQIEMESRQFTCSYCGNLIASKNGYFNDDMTILTIYICPHCDEPTYFDSNENQIPGVAPGNDVQHLPEQLEKLYNEARNCVAVAAYTGSVLLSRKLLMNIGVELGADEGKSFLHYVNYLADQGFVPPNGRGWVDHIRKKGNEATHEIALMNKEDAEELVAFAEMLMKFIYEFPSKVPVDPSVS